MMKKIFRKINLPENPIIENERELNPELYDYLNAVVRLDTNGNIISYNQIFANRFGYNEQDLKNPFFGSYIKRYLVNNKKVF